MDRIFSYDWLALSFMFALGCGILVFVIYATRELTCAYLKINRRIEIQEALLKESQQQTAALIEIAGVLRVKNSGVDNSPGF